MLELLESDRADDSAIARYLDKRGPGLHHITLRVDDIHAALAELRQAGVRLVDETPRPGAEGALVAFVHPSAAHGVLVELKQPAVGARAGRPATVPLFHARPPRARRPRAHHAVGRLLRLDGGAMFGVVPRTLWEQRLPPDDRHRIPLGMRPLIVRGERTLLIDAGCGDKMDAKSAAIYGLERAYHLDHALAEAGHRRRRDRPRAGQPPALRSHRRLHRAPAPTARWCRAFRKARYLAHRGEWHDATHPHERNRASYLPENFMPLAGGRRARRWSTTAPRSCPA